jgi:hypothetical protein
MLGIHRRITVGWLVDETSPLFARYRMHLVGDRCPVTGGALDRGREQPPDRFSRWNLTDATVVPTASAACSRRVAHQPPPF